MVGIRILLRLVSIHSEGGRFCGPIQFEICDII